MKMFDECFVNIVAVSRSLTNYARNVVIDYYHYDKFVILMVRYVFWEDSCCVVEGHI